MKKCFSLVLMVIFLINGLSFAASDPKVTIYYEENAQFEVISPQGVRILMDVYKPSSISKPATEKDILLTTHTHNDHVSAPFLNKFSGKQLFVKTGKISEGDANIQGIASAHNSTDPLPYEPEKGSNYIYIIETAGLRIAHFGDIGQDSLTPEQLNELGKIDIAFTQFYNSYSDMDLINKKGFNLMDQVKPKLIIPTHYNEESAKYAVTKWQGQYSEKAAIEIGLSDLTNQTKIIFMGNFGKVCGENLKLTLVN